MIIFYMILGGNTCGHVASFRMISEYSMQVVCFLIFGPWHFVVVRLMQPVFLLFVGWNMWQKWFFIITQVTTFVGYIFTFHALRLTVVSMYIVILSEFTSAFCRCHWISALWLVQRLLRHHWVFSICIGFGSHRLPFTISQEFIDTLKSHYEATLIKLI